MKNINDILPKIPGLRWGALTNLEPNIRNFRYLNKMLPHDKKWHMIFDTPDSTIVDDIPIVKKSIHSMT